MNIIAKILNGGALNYLLASVIALAATTTALEATSIYWKADKVGGSEESPYLLSEPDN